MNQNTQKTIYLGAASFVLSVLSSLILLITNVGYFLAVPVTVLFVAASCACAGAFALTALLSPTKFYIFIVPAAALCAGVICMSVSAGILALAPFASGAVVAVAAKKRQSKTGAILVSDFCVALALIAAAATAYCFAHKTLAPAAVVGSINGVFDGVKAELVDIFDKAGLYNVFSNIYDLGDMTKEAFLDKLAGEMVFTAKVVSPAVLVTCLNVFSYIATSFFSLFCRISKTDIAIPNGKWTLLPSVVSAWMYVGSMLAFVLFNMLTRYSSSSFVQVLYYAAQNLMIILIAPMLVCGVRGIAGRFRSPMYRRSATIITVICVVLLLFNFLYGIAFAALEGAWDIIMMNKMKKFGNRQE